MEKAHTFLKRIERCPLTFLEIYLIIGLALGLGMFSQPSIIEQLSFTALAASALTVLILWPIFPVVWALKK
jgi:hypothetical protein